MSLTTTGSSWQLAVSGCSFTSNTAQIQQVSGGTGTATGGAIYVLNNYVSSFSCLVNGSSFSKNTVAALAPSTYSNALTSELNGMCRPVELTLRRVHLRASWTDA